MYAKNKYYFPPKNIPTHNHNLINHYCNRHIYSYSGPENKRKLKRIMDYNPNTYDNDPQNRAYIGGVILLDEIYSNYTPNFTLWVESIYQDILKPLVPSKKYILEYFVHYRRSPSNPTFFL